LRDLLQVALFFRFERSFHAFFAHQPQLIALSIWHEFAPSLARFSSYHKLTPENFNNEDVIWLLHHCGDVKFKNANNAQQIEIVTPRKLSFVVVVISVEEHLAAPRS
jgi:hypothetical protein